MTLLGTMLRGGAKLRASVTLDNINLSINQGFGSFERGMSPGSIILEGNKHIAYEKIYRTQPWIYITVNKLSRGIGRLPLKIYRDAADPDARERVRDGWLSDLLKQPFEHGNPFLFKSAIVANVAIHGNCIVVKMRGGPGQPPRELIPSSFAHWQLIQGNDRPVDWYLFHDQRGNVIPFLPEEVIHFRWWGTGMDAGAASPIEPLTATLTLEDAAQRTTTSSYRAGARPVGVLMGPEKTPAMRPEALARFRSEIEKLYGGSDNAFRLAILEGGWKWDAMSHTLLDAEVINTRKLNREEVAAVYDLPPPMIGILDKATFCLPYRASIYTDHGPRPIGDLRAGDQVWSHTPGGFALRPVTRAGCTGADRILRIRTTNRTLEANPTHPILVRRLVKRPGVSRPDAVGRVKSGQSRWGYAVEHSYVPAGDLQVGDVLVTLNALPEFGSTQHSIERMELFGLFVGDGNLMKQQGGALSGISIARAATANYMDHYRAEMSTFTGRGGRGVLLQEGERQTRFSSAIAAREFADLGFSGTAHAKRVPGWVFGMSQSHRLAFLRGFLDADGSVDKKGRISFSSCNPILLDQVRHLCMGVGVPVTNLRCQRGDTVLPNGQRTLYEQWSVTCSDPGANRLIGSHDRRYLERLATGRPFDRKKREYPLAGRGRKREPWLPPAGCSYAKVRGIEELPNEPVYDIEVEDSHNFIADGVVVHNSNVDTQHRMLYQDTFGPWLTMIEETLQASLIDPEPLLQGQYVEFDLNEVLKGDPLQRFEANSKSLTWRTVNEVRATENLPRIDDPVADSVQIGVNMQPVGPGSDYLASRQIAAQETAKQSTVA